MKTTLAAAVMLTCAGVARADAILEYTGADASCHGDFTRVAVQGLSMRIDGAPPGDGYSFVYDAAEKAGVSLDHQRKQLYEMEFDDDAIDFNADVMKSTSNMVEHQTEKAHAEASRLCAETGQPGTCAAAEAMRSAGANGMAAMPQIDPKAMESMMQQSMQHMSADQRKQMEEAMKNLRAMQNPRSAPVVEATGEQREVGGIACSIERVTQDRELLREDCRAPLDQIGVDGADLKRLQRAIGRMEKFASSVRDNLRIGRNMTREMRYPDNLVVERRCFDAGKASGTATLRVRRDEAPAEWFTVPAGYAKADMMGGR
jgi:hypothetical protein